MTIRDTAALRQHARTALENAPIHRRIAYVYTAVMVGLSLALTLADYVLTELISGTGGLGNMVGAAIGAVEYRLDGKILRRSSITAKSGTEYKSSPKGLLEIIKEIFNG